jgi:hypothetical protein
LAAGEDDPYKKKALLKGKVTLQYYAKQRIEFL